MTEVDPKLRQVLSDHSHDPHHQVPVIVALARGANSTNLSDLGMTVKGSTANAPIVFGTLDFVTLERLAQHSSVKRIELDEDRAHTLDDPGR